MDKDGKKAFKEAMEAPAENTSTEQFSNDLMEFMENQPFDGWYMGCADDSGLLANGYCSPNQMVGFILDLFKRLPERLRLAIILGLISKMRD